MGIQNNKNEQIAKEEIAAFRVQFFLINLVCRILATNPMRYSRLKTFSDTILPICSRWNRHTLLASNVIAMCPRMHSLYCHPIQSFAKLCCSMPASLSAQWQRL